ncbi:MAG: 2,4-diaminopentanoate dehydrogenase [Caldisericia bacterium]|jgi:4-hydroxy-tetrahydrodipicolinate reductase|nr:2,4-diaminopentanoate dehydrogenase [Caldisericia bacterium]
MKKFRVAVYGTGAMGSGIISLILEKKNLELVGVVSKRKERKGIDIGEIIGKGTLGIKISIDPLEVIKNGVDIFIHATCSRVKDAYPEIVPILKNRVNVITIAEEMAYPWRASKELAESLDKLAKEGGVTLLGTGVNPGFVLDTLIIALTGVMKKINKIYAKRVNDLSPYGPSVMKTQGVGTTIEEFNEGLKKGEIVGHFGFPESISMICDALNWKLEKIEEYREPIISNVYRKTQYIEVKPGMVAGCKHVAKGFVDGEEKIILEHPQQILPQLEGVETGDYIFIEGEPPINFVNKPEIQGGVATISIAVNMIPIVYAARPGLLTMKDLPIPRFLD